MLEALFSFTLAFFLSYLAIPIVIRLSQKYGVVDISNERKSHSGAIPSIGGVGIFLSVFLVALVWIPELYFIELRYILSALIIIFLVGAKDDIDPISPMTKLYGQILGVSLLIFLGDVRLTSFYGLFGWYDISYVSSCILTLFYFLLIINSFNLIDGINGLASSLVIFSTSLLGIWFLSADAFAYSLFSFSVSGATLAFLKYNITPARIFMGDTGSLVLGAICAILIIQFLEINNTFASGPFTYSNAPAVAFAILIIPIFDTIRILLIRLGKGNSPFLADKNHIHHILLDSGWSHMQVTCLLLTINFLMLIIAISLPDYGAFIMMVSMMFMTYILITLLQWLPVMRRKVITGSSQS